MASAAFVFPGVPMPIHDWSKVDSGLFHAFHHDWITELHSALNAGLLPSDYYALPEQQAAGFGPDVLTLQNTREESGGGTAVAAKPQTKFAFASTREFHRRKKSTVVVRHISGDRIVAFLELVSPGKKSSRSAFRAFLEKAWDLIENRIHLLIVDLHPPGKRDPQGIHAAIWEAIDDTQPFELPEGKPLTLASYQSGWTTNAFVEPVAVGDLLPNMPLYLNDDDYVSVPLEETYRAACPDAETGTSDG